jgi:eukaryotic-like serine/threonine-protein kinase
MNACPNDDDLLQFLDGELKADDEARVLAHVEDCGSCQAHLERLTEGRPVAGEKTPIATVQTDPDPTVDLRPTEIVGRDVGDPENGADLRQPEDAGTREKNSGADEVAAPGSTADFSLAPAASQAASTEDDPDRTDSVNGANPKTAQVGRKPAPTDWPTIPGYDILQRIGEGGMGVVYKARHLGLKRLVALKMIRGGTQARAEQFSRFRLEAEAVARLRHPNILQIYDIGEAGGLPFVALELLEGGGLDDRLARTPQPGKQAAELMATLARAIHVAHLAGIVHRDLKPTNVLYTSDGVPKITDFGLAKRTDSDDGHTESGQIMGSPSYMAPEQARGDSRKVKAPADVYALGAILYEMLTGRPPFKAATPLETVRQVLDDDPVTPSRLVPRVPRDLETICLKCLHKDPARRYESAEILADDLERYVRGKPILARPTLFWERGAKWVRRHPVAAMLLALVTTAILGGFVGALEFQRRWNQAERDESDRIATAKIDVMGKIVRAKDELAENKLAKAEATLATLIEKIKAEAKLKDLKVTVQELLDEVKGRQAAQLLRESDRERYAKFLGMRNEALFHDTQFTDLDLPSNQEATRRAAQDALDLYAAADSRESGAPGSLASSLSAPERTEIANGCYTLLLVMADAEPTPEAGLRRLDQAARLRPLTRAYHLRRAACLARAGNQAEATQERRAAEQLQPTTAFDHFLVGQEAYKRQDWITALRHFDQAIQLERDQFWAHALSALCWLQPKIDMPVLAKASLTTCLEREPGFAWLYILRGFASSRIPARSPQEAARGFENAEADYDRAWKLLAQMPNDELRYVLLVNRGVLRFQHGKLDQAATDLQAAIQLNDHLYHPHEGLARVYLKQGKPDEAVGQFGLAIERKSDLAALYRGRADVHLARQDPTPAQRAQALGDLAQAIRLERPENRVLARDHTNRGRLLALEHRDADALAAWDVALKVDRDHLEAHSLRIDLLLRLKRYDDVIRSCDALIARGKATPAIYELRGLARAERKDFAGAIEDVTSAMALLPPDQAPKRAALLSRRGWLYIVADAPRLALHDFQAAIQLDPSIGDAYNGRGFARLRLGEHRDAVADAEKALGTGKPTSHLFYNAARVYALAAIVAAADVRKNGQETVTLVARYQDRATGLLREALKRMPDDQRASFWRDVVPADPALRTLRRRVSDLDGSGEGRRSSVAPAARASPKAG